MSGREPIPIKQMTLEDWFAGQILPVLYKAALDRLAANSDASFSDAEIAGDAYILADEMVRMRDE